MTHPNTSALDFAGAHYICFVMGPRWEHFEHKADMGVRGFAPTLAGAFEQGALAVTAAVCDPASVKPIEPVTIRCAAPDDEILFVDWLNAVIFEMATRHMLFSRFSVNMGGSELNGTAWGEAVDINRHAPAVEPKGATFTELSVGRSDGHWIAQCVIDV